MKLTIVLVNFKCDKIKLQSCLDSIRINTEVLIIDHSHDFTFDGIKKPQNLNIKVIKNINMGNGAGINCGVKNSITRYVLYLDIDTILPPDFFEILNSTIKKINNFAVMAPKTNDIYNESSINKTGNLNIYQYLYIKFFYKSKLEKNTNPNIKEQFFVSGSIMLIDKKNTFDLGIQFDENIFLYFEETDFFMQCLKKNKKIYLIQNLEAYHWGGSVNDKSIEFECFKKWHWEWSKYYYYNKHYNKIIVSWIALISIIKFTIKTFIYFFIDKNKNSIFKSRLNGLLSYYLNKKKINIK
jgi:N-acetylglucosaminyl-diphospho-decaprenol L-rhamnosyltransferase